MEYTVEVQGLTKRYPGFTLDHVSFAVPSGSIVGFIGENGAGKSTTMKAVLNLIRRDEGSVRLLGREDGAEYPETTIRPSGSPGLHSTRQSSPWRA